MQAPEPETVHGKRDRAMLALLLGSGVRRSGLLRLTMEHIQQREGKITGSSSTSSAKAVTCAPSLSRRGSRQGSIFGQQHPASIRERFSGRASGRLGADSVLPAQRGVLKAWVADLVPSRSGASIYGIFNWVVDGFGGTIRLRLHSTSLPGSPCWLRVSCFSPERTGRPRTPRAWPE